MGIAAGLTNEGYGVWDVGTKRWRSVDELRLPWECGDLGPRATGRIQERSEWSQRIQTAPAARALSIRKKGAVILSERGVRARAKDLLLYEPLNLQGNLPQLLPLLQPLQRGARLGERIHAVHHGPQLPLSQPPHHLRILGEVAHRRAHDRPVIPEEASEIDRDVGA